MPFAFLAELERRVSSPNGLDFQKLMTQFTAQYTSDDIVSAGGHSMGDFETELAKVGSPLSVCPVSLLTRSSCTNTRHRLRPTLSNKRKQT